MGVWIFFESFFFVSKAESAVIIVAVLLFVRPYACTHVPELGTQVFGDSFADKELELLSFRFVEQVLSLHELGE